MKEKVNTHYIKLLFFLKLYLSTRGFLKMIFLKICSPVLKNTLNLRCFGLFMN